MNKVAFNIFLVVCSFLVITVGLAVTMMITPGLDILGLRYIRSTSGSYYEKQSVYCADSPVQEFNISCDNIPINIVFVQSYTFSVVLDEQFNGYTKTVENPDLAVDNAGNKVNFAVQEYVPFVYHNRIDGSALTISVPIYYRGVVAVQSRNSNITIDGLNGMLSDLIITTGGKVDVNDVTLSKLHLNLGSRATNINSGAKISELYIEAENSKITIADPIDGKITYKAQGGGLYFNSCSELDVEASSAKVSSSTEEMAKVTGNAKIVTSSKIGLDVYGDAEITTKGGNVTLGAESIAYTGKVVITTKGGSIKLNGRRSGVCALTTKSGDVWVENVSDCTIETTYGFVDIEECTNAKITAGSGNVQVRKSNGDVSINSRSGDVSLGQSDNTLNANFEINTLGGNVLFNNAVGGKHSVTTQSGDVTYIGSTNNETEVVVVSKKGDVIAENMTGLVKIETQGSVNLKMASLEKGVKVLAKDKPVIIEAINNELTYNLTTTEANNINIFGEIIKDYYLLTDINANIEIITDKGEIVVCENYVKESK